TSATESRRCESIRRLRTENPHMSTYSRCLTLIVLAFAARIGAAVETSTRDVVFRHGDVELAGTLIAPTKTVAPAMILMPGSGVQSRAPLLDLAREFAAQGIATLAWDKQGVGKSGGSWTRESLDDLAGDAQAAIALLRSQPNVDPKRIGAWGI